LNEPDCPPEPCGMRWIHLARLAISIGKSDAVERWTSDSMVN